MATKLKHPSAALVVLLWYIITSCQALSIQKPVVRTKNCRENARDRTARPRRAPGPNTRPRQQRQVLSCSAADDDSTARTVQISVSSRESSYLQSLPDLRSLPPPPGPTSDDDFTRWLKRTFPVAFQFWLRDSGVLRSLMDGLVILGVPRLLGDYPTALPRFLRLSGVNYFSSSQLGVSTTTRLASIFAKTETAVGQQKKIHFETINYGPHPLQTIDVLSPNINNTRPSQLILFCHGGAWGSGRPWMYRLVADMFMKQKESTTCCLWGYRTYPDGAIKEQLKDLEGAILELSRRYPNTLISILAHSSGAHVCLLRVLEWIKQESRESERLLASIESMILMSGVYDIKAHEQWEATRGVDLLSPMQPACEGDVERCARYSPTKLIQELEYEFLDKLPPLWLIHGVNDTVVPYRSTFELAEALHLKWQTGMSNGDKLRVDFLFDCSHVDPILQLMMGGPLQALATGWIEERTRRP